MILSILPSAAFDAAGARSTPPPGVKALFHPATKPMLHFPFVRSVQIHPVGHQYAAR